jgi:hypothetical protein
LATRTGPYLTLSADGLVRVPAAAAPALGLHELTTPVDLRYSDRVGCIQVFRVPAGGYRAAVFRPIDPAQPGRRSNWFKWLAGFGFQRLLDFVSEHDRTRLPVLLTPAGTILRTRVGDRTTLFSVELPAGSAPTDAPALPARAAGGSGMKRRPGSTAVEARP